MNKAFCLAILFAVPGLAARMHYDSPFGKRELNTRINMTPHQFPCDRPNTFQVANVTILTSGTTVRMSGSDKAGKPWVLLGTTDNCMFWEADLDGDGVSDFVFARSLTVGNLDLLIVMFDNQCRPVPWIITGHFQRDDNGILELVDVDGDHHAELIITEWVPCSQDDCWVTDAYEARDGYWHKLHGLAGRTLPIGSRTSSNPDYSNVFSDAGELVRYSPRTTDTCLTLRLPEAEGRIDAIDDCHDWLILSNGRACPAAPIVILDRKDGRYIGRSKLVSNAHAGAKVRIAGRARAANGCESLYTWITEP